MSDVGEGFGLATLEGHHHDVGLALEPEPRETARGVGARELAGAQPIEEIALQPPLGVRDGPGLRQLDGEQRQRVTGDDAIELTQLLGLAHGEERLDAPLGSHGLDPDVMAPVDERHARTRCPRVATSRSSPHTRSARSEAARPVAASGRPCRSRSRTQPFTTAAERVGDALRSPFPP